MMTDPVADMLTRIRNASRTERPVVDMPASRLKVGVADVLKTEGFIHDYQVGVSGEDEHGVPTLKPAAGAGDAKQTLRIVLKYGPEGERVIRQLSRVSTPGCRVYRGFRELRPVLDGLGVTVVSTSKGVMSDRKARQKKLGGELLCNVW